MVSRGHKNEPPAGLPGAAQCVKRSRSDGSASELLHQGLELHGDGHVTGNFQFALHEGHGRVQRAGGELGEVIPADRDGSVSCAVGIVGHACGAVDEQLAGAAEVEFNFFLEIAAASNRCCCALSKLGEIHQASSLD